MPNFLAVAYLICLHLAVPLALTIAVIAWRNRELWGVRSLPPLLGIGLAWSLSLVLGAYSPTAEWAHFWIYQVRMAFIAFAPGLTLIVILEFAGRQSWLRPLPLALLFVIPTVSQIFLFTDAATYFMEPAEVRTFAGFWTLSSHARGPWFKVYFTYTYVVSLAALAIISYEIVRSRAPYRRRAAILVVGLLASYLSAVPNTAGILPPPHFDWTVFGLCAQAILWTVVLARDPAVFDFMPVARDAMFELIDDAIIAIDHRGDVADANPAAEKLFAGPDGKLVGRAVTETRARSGIPLAQLLGDDPAGAEIEIDGHVYEIRRKRLGGRARQAGVVIALHDITEHKKLIADLEAFAGAVAHDLRNPIGAIVGYTEMAAEESGASALSRETYRIVVDRARDMIETIDALLLMARVEHEEQVAVEVVDMYRAVDKAKAGLALLIEQRRARIELVGPLPQVRAFAPWVAAAFANYLSNAIKYGGSPPVVRIGADDAGDFVRFWVEDNGQGLAPQQRAAIFRAFTRVGETRVAGHGLGLSIVRRIVEKLGGDVGVDSAPGRGCTFWFTLPKVEDAEIEVASAA